MADADALPRRRGWAEWALIVLLHAAGLVTIYVTEHGLFAQSLALMTWAFLNLVWIMLLRRPILSAALSLAMIGVLIVLSEFKHSILQINLTFLDFLIIDQDTVAFLLAIFPQLRIILFAGIVVALPLIWLFWRQDTRRIRRRTALAGVVACLGGVVASSTAWPEMPWEPFSGVNHVSNFARSGVAQVSYLVMNDWLEADRKAVSQIQGVAHETCTPATKPPHIIMVLDESSFDITAAPGIKVPEGYKDYFKSLDGKQRSFIAEATGGPTWYTEFNVLTGLSSRSFGALKFYVTRIAAGRVGRGLPQALKRCGYRTYSLYPTYGNFLSARTFQTSAGMSRFIDMQEMGVTEDMQQDEFYFDQASHLFGREQGKGDPIFMFVYLTANHFPWTNVYRPDLTPGWTGYGNSAEVDEYIRRQRMTARAYDSFRQQLARDFPDEQFLLVRFGDHQPAISHKLLEPGLDPQAVSARVRLYDPRYFTTYYAFDAINYTPKDLSSALGRLDAAYLPIAIQETAGLPLDATFAEQKKVMLRCSGLFYACQSGAEARRFNRLLIEAGLIKNL